MEAPRTRLDRFISSHAGINRRDVRAVLASGRVLVDGVMAREINQVVHEFSHIVLDGKVLQANTPSYVMMHKPAGVVSATKDPRHKTVIDLLDRPDRSSLHIVGRLDFNSSGLLLLTNDGRWSRRLSLPETKVAKVYRVKLAKALTQDYVAAFAEGMYFAYEHITTRPAILKILDETEAEVVLEEGRYHQIKRMFGRFDNEVLELHRVSVGGLSLDPNLAAGQSRDLTAAELAGFKL
ncbi:MAG: 16S rRNA pseudouridine(516) synthase [Pseudomonadales bacterium]